MCKFKHIVASNNCFHQFRMIVISYQILFSTWMLCKKKGHDWWSLTKSMITLFPSLIQCRRLAPQAQWMLLMYFCIKITPRPMVKIFRQQKCFKSPSRLFMLPTVLMRWSWCSSDFVWFCGVYYGAFHVESCLALCSGVLSVLFSIVISALGEERGGLYATRALVC